MAGAVIGAAVMLLLAIIGSHVMTASRLTAIETRLDERDRGTADRAELYQGRAEKAMQAWCETQCPRRHDIDSSYGRANTAPGGVPIVDGQ